MRRTLILIMGMIMSFAMVGTAVAQNPHYVVGPDFAVDDNVVTATGSIAGLGNQDIDLELIVEASATVLCRNPGGNIAPGQTKFFEATTTQTNLETKNGRVNFSISAEAVPTQADLAGACPNPRWTPIADEITVHSATLNVYQPAGSGNLVLTDTVTF